MPAISLDLTERQLLPLGDGLRQMDFEDNPEFDHRWWRADIVRSRTNKLWYSGTDRGAEVMRAQLDLATRISPSYPGVPEPRNSYVQIVRLEIAASRRCTGYGHAAVDHLLDLHPRRAFAAFSEADGFWDSLRWTRIEHEEGTRFQPLYLLPPGRDD